MESKIKKTTKFKREVILKSAIDIAQKLNVIAIVVSKNIVLSESHDIPVYYLPEKRKNLISQLSSKTEISDILIEQVTESAEDIENRSFVEYISKNISSGTVLGIFEKPSSIAIILHDINKNKLVKAIKSYEEKIEYKCLKIILLIAFDLSASGREGAKIGAAFIIGDSQKVLEKSHQLILNPYMGQEKESCDILNPRNWESVKEFSQLDGVFVISKGGLIRAAGRYLDVDAKDVKIDKGFGGRHVSAAAITKLTNSIAVTLSESGGIVRIYEGGKEIFSY